MFNIGQKVICINDDFSHVISKSDFNYPVFGATYTVRRITIYGIALTEVTNKEFIWTKHNNIVHEPMFNENRFVPLFGDEQEIESSELEKVL